MTSLWWRLPQCILTLIITALLSGASSAGASPLNSRPFVSGRTPAVGAKAYAPGGCQFFRVS
jgi:hypothetical protein